MPIDVDPLHLALGVLAALFLVVTLALAMRSARLRDARAELHRLRRQSEELATLRAEARRLPQLEDETRNLRAERDEEGRARAAAEQELRSVREAHEARLEELRGMKKDLEDRFSSLASGALKNNSEAFLGLVTERFDKHKKDAADDLGKRQEAIQNLVKPLNEKLGTFDQRIQEIEKARNEAYGAIQAQVQELAKGQQSLGTETRRLVQALRAPKTRGRWGEMQLRQVFDMAGMAEHVDYSLEDTMSTDRGLRRPDAIVRIPGGKSIVVDAKTPLEAYLDAIEADTPDLQAQQLKRHASQVRSHVKQLASKAYQDQIAETPDFIVMFIPGETFVSAAAEADPGLIEYAFENKVLIATPTTLMALVKAIAYGWQQERMAENAAEVQKVAKELYERLAVFAGHLDKVGSSLKSSTEAYNKAIGSLETRILPSARKFEQMGVVSQQKTIDDPKGVETEPRKLTASEFVGE
ncbi:DNA recombination protein RmuC [Tranquillimonas rosea]|uniref:DNA recombination protein RmuC n=1 Tax=Tranquillimonas rosea TaxID=641238 RepID=UPI003BAB4DB1